MYYVFFTHYDTDYVDAEHIVVKSESLSMSPEYVQHPGSEWGISLVCRSSVS